MGTPGDRPTHLLTVHGAGGSTALSGQVRERKGRSEGSESHWCLLGVKSQAGRPVDQESDTDIYSFVTASVQSR